MINRLAEVHLARRLGALAPGAPAVPRPARFAGKPTANLEVGHARTAHQLDTQRLGMVDAPSSGPPRIEGAPGIPPRSACE